MLWFLEKLKAIKHLLKDSEMLFTDMAKDGYVEGAIIMTRVESKKKSRKKD